MGLGILSEKKPLPPAKQVQKEVFSLRCGFIGKATLKQQYNKDFKIKNPAAKPGLEHFPAKFIQLAITKYGKTRR